LCRHIRLALSRPIPVKRIRTPRANRHRPHNMAAARNAGIDGAGHGLEAERTEVEHTEAAAEAEAGKTHYSRVGLAVVRYP
jgi:hypothetical protein